MTRTLTVALESRSEMRVGRSSAQTRSRDSVFGCMMADGAPQLTAMAANRMLPKLRVIDLAVRTIAIPAHWNRAARP